MAQIQNQQQARAPIDHRAEKEQWNEYNAEYVKYASKYKGNYIAPYRRRDIKEPDELQDSNVDALSLKSDVTFRYLEPGIYHTTDINNSNFDIVLKEDGSVEAIWAPKEDRPPKGFGTHVKELFSAPSTYDIFRERIEEMVKFQVARGAKDLMVSFKDLTYINPRHLEICHEIMNKYPVHYDFDSKVKDYLMQGNEHIGRLLVRGESEKSIGEHRDRHYESIQRNRSEVANNKELNTIFKRQDYKKLEGNLKNAKKNAVPADLSNKIEALPADARVIELKTQVAKLEKRLQTLDASAKRFREIADGDEGCRSQRDNVEAMINEEKNNLKSDAQRIMALPAANDELRARLTTFEEKTNAITLPAPTNNQEEQNLNRPSI